MNPLTLDYASSCNTQAQRNLTINTAFKPRTGPWKNNRDETSVGLPRPRRRVGATERTGAVAEAKSTCPGGFRESGGIVSRGFLEGMVSLAGCSSSGGAELDLWGVGVAAARVAELCLTVTGPHVSQAHSSVRPRKRETQSFIFILENPRE
jgi:hypothetical protein